MYRPITAYTPVQFRRSAIRPDREALGYMGSAVAGGSVSVDDGKERLRVVPLTGIRQAGVVWTHKAPYRGPALGRVAKTRTLDPRMRLGGWAYAHQTVAQSMCWRMAMQAGAKAIHAGSNPAPSISAECVVGVNRRNGDYSNQRGWLCVTPDSVVSSRGAGRPAHIPAPHL
jgi:hypothetical protein